MARVTPQEYAEKWGRRLKASGEDIRRGIDRVSVAPGEAAAQNQEALLTNFQEAVNSGLWAARVRGVTLQEWKDSAKNKGLPRIAQGVDAALPKMAAIAGPLLQAVDEAAAAANALPKVTLEDSIQRMTTFVREMHRRAPRRQGV
ncbi:hypothetical protein LCGC14_0912090 [marine sediment metagenome]|uniref:Phasin domain-containing protein n=1 Tax=marine sediment metagenome TaxID=412755 RepID=A0A0F9S061_9ZZZZ